MRQRIFFIKIISIDPQDLPKLLLYQRHTSASLIYAYTWRQEVQTADNARHRHASNDTERLSISAAFKIMLGRLAIREFLVDIIIAQKGWGRKPLATSVKETLVFAEEFLFMDFVSVKWK